MWLSEHLKRLVTVDASAPAVEADDGRWWTWGDLGRWFDRIVEFAESQGVELPADVAVVVENRFAEYACVAAVLSSRCTLVPLSPLKNDTALADEISVLRPGIVLAGDSNWSNAAFRTAVERVGAQGIALGRGDSGAARILVGANAARAGEKNLGADVAVLMSTSGTTGSPQRVPLRYDTLEKSLRHTRRHHVASDGSSAVLRSSVVILMNPPVHMAGFDAALRALVEGRKACLLERFTVEAFEAALRRHKPRIVSLVPTALRMVYEAGVPVDAFEATEIVLSGSAPLSTTLWRDFEAKYGVAILVNYGATEFAGGIAGWTIRDHQRCIGHKRGSVGRPHPGVELRVVDTNGQPLPAGERGLLHVRSVHLGPDWLPTADLAHVDVDGFLWLEGRSDGVITRGGFKVWPAEVEAVLESHPAVREACVVARADARLGEVPVAAVELMTGAPIPANQELIAWARTRLTGYQTPVEILVFDELPRTQSMKVARGTLRDLARDGTRARIIGRAEEV